MRADDQLRLAGGELLACGALLRGSSGAGQQQHAHAERPEQLRERPRVLLGQNFRGGHEGGLPAVPDGAEARGSCDHRLAAADIALHEPVHHMAGGQILQDLVDRALLRAGQTEGQRGIKALHAVRRIRLGRQLRPGRAQDGQARGEDEKLLKDQPLARPLQRGPIGRLVDRRIGLGHAAKIIFPPHLFRQDLRQQLRRERERLLHALGHQAVGKSRRQRIDRQQTVRHGAGPVRRVVRGVRHLHPVLGLQGAVEVIALAVVQLVFDVGLVEIAERQLAGLVGDDQLRDVPPAADAAQNRLRDDHRPEAGRDARLQLCDRDRVRPVLIVAREEGQQVIERADPQLFQLRRPRRPNAMQLPHRRKQIHPALLSCRNSCRPAGLDPKPSPMRGRWHGEAVTDEVEALALT